MVDIYFLFYLLLCSWYFSWLLLSFSRDKITLHMNILFKTCILICPSGSTEIYCSSFTTGNPKALLLIRHMCLPIKNHWMLRKNSETGSYTQANSQRMRRCLFQVSDGIRRLFVLSKCGNHMNYLSPIYHLCLSPAPELGVGNGVRLTDRLSITW